MKHLPLSQISLYCSFYCTLGNVFIGVLQGLGEYDICLIPMEKYSNCLCHCGFRTVQNTKNRTLTRGTAQKNLLC